MSLDFIISFLSCFECLAFNPDLLCLIDVNLFSLEIFSVVGCILVLIVLALVRLLFTPEFALPVSFGTMLLVLNSEDKSEVIEIVQDVF